MVVEELTSKVHGQDVMVVEELTVKVHGQDVMVVEEFVYLEMTTTSQITCVIF